MAADTFKDYTAEKKIVTVRAWASMFLMLLLLIGLACRLFYLQVIRYSEMSTQSDENRVHLRAIPPIRGLIYDTSGKLVAMNRSSRILAIVRERVSSIDNLLFEIAALIPLSDSEIGRYRRRFKRGRPFEAICFCRGRLVNSPEPTLKAGTSSPSTRSVEALENGVHKY